MTPLPANLHTLGIVAGAGECPRMVIEAAKRAGVRIICAGIRGSVGADIPPLCDAYACFRAGALEATHAFLAAHGVKHLMMTGQIRPSTLYTMWPDTLAIKLLAQLDRRNAHSIFGILCEQLELRGITVLPATTFMEDYMPGPGHLAGPEPTDAQLLEADHGLELAREIARLDIGQSLVVHGDRVMCVEAFKGTNECLHAGGHRPHPVTLCKVTKPGHDMRFDVPCIGLGTIRNAVQAGVNHIALEANRTIIFQRENVLELCHRHGITLHARPVPPGGIHLPDPGHVHSDAEHACFIAGAIEQLGIGHSAVVCDGVVIAVEDPDGPLKCISRARTYMNRLRLTRLLNWLCGLLLRRHSAPPAPMVFGHTEALAITPALRRALKRAGIRDAL